VIQQRLGARDKSHGVRQTGMSLERQLVFPAGMDVEDLAIADAAKRMNAEAAIFFPGCAYDLAQSGLQRRFPPLAGVKASEDE
jgi:hypothetical protein